ncbi:alpha/beta-hydrolase [Microstroma glucosiphilum]|uniref:Palmitoyl-protein thioesterase 1 n=1 Tax=Pseudomicrostroma glucosiphilum TaxID=1684307 RepID=A0A316UDU1_9BASI|nr:alpha/beta-hydrolase [Pseudomicrostroma glucosiphilum]PWN22511.1 alpha/beta-hydrolase [Pseudomicrostroma glucosiphilum]
MRAALLTPLLAALASYVSLVNSAPALTATPSSQSSPSSSTSSSWWPSSLFSKAKPHPLVLWHGLGDSAFSSNLADLKDSLEEAFPGIYVHLIALGKDEASDRNRGVFGEVDKDVKEVCKTLQEVEELKDGFDAVGFSQGGQFLRALVQRCPQVKVRNLVTFGSQHMGISDFPACQSGDLICRLTEVALRSGIYTDYAQTHVVTAQYYRNPLSPTAFERYLESNHFLTDINNEIPGRQKKVYKERLQALDAFVMLQFDQDTTVVPKRSSWFESYAIANESSTGTTPETIPLRQSDIYLEDRLGLKTLDKRGALVMEVCKGAHMQIDSACQQKVFGTYIGSPRSLFSRSLPRRLRHAWHRLFFMLSGIQGVATWPWSAHLLALLYVAGVMRLVYLAGRWMGGKTREHMEVRRARKEGSIRLP